MALKSARSDIFCEEVMILLCLFTVSNLFWSTFSGVPFLEYLFWSTMIMTTLQYVCELPSSSKCYMPLTKMYLQVNCLALSFLFPFSFSTCFFQEPVTSSCGPNVLNFAEKKLGSIVLKFLSF